MLADQQLQVGVTVNVDIDLDHSTLYDNDKVERHCFDDEDANCDLRGGLYTWQEAMQYASEAQGICPWGWRIPSDADWKVLEGSLGMKDVDGTDWRGTDQGDQLKAGAESGFDLQYGGYAHEIHGHYDFFGPEDTRAVLGPRARRRRRTTCGPGCSKTTSRESSAPCLPREPPHRSAA